MTIQEYGLDLLYIQSVMSTFVFFVIWHCINKIWLDTHAQFKAYAKSAKEEKQAGQFSKDNERNVISSYINCTAPDLVADSSYQGEWLNKKVLNFQQIFTLPQLSLSLFPQKAGTDGTQIMDIVPVKVNEWMKVNWTRFPLWGCGCFHKSTDRWPCMRGVIKRVVRGGKTHMCEYLPTLKLWWMIIHDTLLHATSVTSCIHICKQKWE